ncbi:MAG: hypothetical protein ACXAC5_03890 [Promethearchaeota archaeon]|jgi:hypothetical protein
MKFNISFTSLNEAKKKQTRVVTIEAPNDMLATEWADKQAEHWGQPDLDSEVTFVSDDLDEYIAKRDQLSPGFAELVSKAYKRRLEEMASREELEINEELATE